MEASMNTKNLSKLIPIFFPKTLVNFASKKDLYQTLGVSKNATQSQIKKAYYKLAQQHHPDKSKSANAKDKFSEINNAYEVLSDDAKRRSYDQNGTTDQDQGGFSQQDVFKHFYSSNGFYGGGGRGKGRGRSQQDVDFGEIFEEFFGSFEGPKQSHKKKNHQKQDLVVKLDIDFKEAVNGTKKTIKYSRTNTCGTCKGSKSSPGTKPQRCVTCQGTGFMTMRQGIMMLRMECSGCQGQGVKITSPCGTCSGKGTVRIESQEQVLIPRGIHDGATLKFKGKGNMNGDLNIKVNVKKHPQIRRQGIDCLYDRVISIVDAVLGCQIEITTIYDQRKKIKIPSGTQNNDQIKVNREGFYKLNSTEKGNMVITIRVQLPRKINDQQRRLYEQLRKVIKEGK